MTEVTESHEITPPVEEQEPTAEGLINVVEDRPAVRVPNSLNDEYCSRCDSKGNVYLEAGLMDEAENQSGWLQDGERVRFFAWFNVDPNEDGDMKGWQIRSLHHIDHIEKDMNEVAQPGKAQAFATAGLDECGVQYEPTYPDGEPYEVEDRSVLRDVQVTSFSPVGYGEEAEPIREPDEHGMVTLERDDPRPGFPDELNTWRKELLKANDAWDIDELPHVSLDAEESHPRRRNEPIEDGDVIE